MKASTAIHPTFVIAGNKSCDSSYQQNFNRIREERVCATNRDLPTEQQCEGKMSPRVLGFNLYINSMTRIAWNALIPLAVSSRVNCRIKTFLADTICRSTPAPRALLLRMLLR